MKNKNEVKLHLTRTSEKLVSQLPLLMFRSEPEQLENPIAVLHEALESDSTALRPVLKARSDSTWERFELVRTTFACRDGENRLEAAQRVVRDPNLPRVKEALLQLFLVFEKG